jgi:hypothetical protein
MDRPLPTAVMQGLEFTDPPVLVAHADWSINPEKRWMASAEFVRDNYFVHSLELVGDLSNFLYRMINRAGNGGCVLIGFDYPIGLPNTYAQLTGISNFCSVLPVFGEDEWRNFYDVAESADQITLLRPFYPHRPTGARRQDLLNKLGIGSFDELLRTCEKAPPLQRPAAPLFWTLGAQQVGKAAINGWKNVIAPAFKDSNLDLAIWPFSGRMAELVRPGKVIIVETYPAEFVHQLGLVNPHIRFSKKQQKDRILAAGRLLKQAVDSGIQINPELEQSLLEGLGFSPIGEDRFDAVVGLIGMLQILYGVGYFSEPENETVREIEGWIYGLASEKVIV